MALVESTPAFWSPLPACGERSDRIADAIRVRGYRSIDKSRRVEGAPHPNPLPARAGRGSAPSAAVDGLLPSWLLNYGGAKSSLTLLATKPLPRRLRRLPPP